MPYAVPDAQNISTLETIILRPRSFPSSQEYCQECDDRTNLQATITNENREAAPRLRHRGVPATNLTHVSVHCKDCLHGFQIPALISTGWPAHVPYLARAGSRDYHNAGPASGWVGPDSGSVDVAVSALQVSRAGLLRVTADLRVYSPRI